MGNLVFRDIGPVGDCRAGRLFGILRLRFGVKTWKWASQAKHDTIRFSGVGTGHFPVFVINLVLLSFLR